MLSVVIVALVCPASRAALVLLVFLLMRNQYGVTP
jgi:hypothetical protein